MQEEAHDAVTGEITDKLPQRERAADGQIVPQTALTGGAFIDLLEDGQFSQDIHAHLQELAAALTDISQATGNKAKGKVTLTIDLSKDGEAFTLQGKIAVKMPELPRPKSIMWTDERNQFCRFPPNQVQMFGVGRPLRNV